MSKGVGNIQDWDSGISIIVPTFRRPAGLKNALESLKHQNADGRALEIVVSDNDPEGTARLYVKDFASKCRFPVIYVHATQPGVANARNIALKTARGRYLAFLDDDQIASENWLEGLMNVMSDHGAGLAFCPTFAQSEKSIKFKPQCLEFFTRDIHKTTDGLVDQFFGCGNSVLDLEKCNLPSPPFSPATNETGGEDDLLFSQLQSQGTLIAWTSKTHAKENVENWRMSHAYIRVRSFAYGQGPSRICADNSDVIGLMKWSIIGLVQVCVYGPLSMISKLLGHKSYMRFMRKAAEGAGKMLWYEKFRPKIYGATALKAQINRENDLDSVAHNAVEPVIKEIPLKKVS